MPRYEIECASCGRQEFFASIKTAGSFMPCPLCERPRPQVIYPPQFSEDRLRFWVGPMGNRYSTALGAEMPETKKKRDQLAREKGVEFTTKSEFLADNKEAAAAVAYKKDVDSGGRRDPWEPPDTSGAFKAKPDWAKDLVK
jgi:hypothetical protein